MKKHNRFGFGAIEAVLILVIVGLIAGTGYYVWHSKQNTDKNLSNAANTNQIAAKKTAPASSKTAAPSDETADWQKISTEKWTMKIPDGWTVTKFNNSEITAIFNKDDMLAIKSNSKATINSTASFDDMDKGGFAVLEIEFGSSSEGGPIGQTQPPLKTTQGLSIIKRFASKNVDPSELPNGLDSYYEYFLESKGVVLMAKYRVYSGQNNYYQNVEKALQTVDIL